MNRVKSLQGRFKKLSIVGGIFKGKIEIELYPLDKVEKRVD